MSESKPENEDVKPIAILTNADKNSGCSRIALLTSAVVGMLVFLMAVFTALLVFSGTLTVSGLLSSIGDLLGGSATATVVPTRTIVNKLQPLGQLVTISAEVAQADIMVSVNTGGINLCGHSANHVAQGVVEAGVDIAEIGEESVSYAEDTDTYILTLPAPGITSCRIEYIRQYERNSPPVPCSIDWDSLRLLAQYEATTLFAADTLQAGILDRAKREATLLMQSFVSALTDSKVEVVYTQSDESPALPPSCQPQLPRGWRFNDEQNNWAKSE